VLLLSAFPFSRWAAYAGQRLRKTQSPVVDADATQGLKKVTNPAKNWL